MNKTLFGGNGYYGYSGCTVVHASLGKDRCRVPGGASLHELVIHLLLRRVCLDGGVKRGPAALTFSHLDPAWGRRLLCSPLPGLLSSETPSTSSFLYEPCPLSRRPGPASRSRSWRSPAATRRPARPVSALWPSETACRAPGLPSCPWWPEQEDFILWSHKL